MTAWLIALLLAAAPVVAPPPITGDDVPRLRVFDRTIAGLLMAYGVPGASVALAKDGRIVYARGFGLADREAGRPVQPESLFRLASISKPITAVAIMTLVEAGRLQLDDLAVNYLDGLPPPDGAEVDPRWDQITIRHLLEHAGGFDRGQSGDPMFRPQSTAEAMGVPAPADARTIIRYLRGRPLDFDPGSREVYSNFGYCVLGRIIEQVSGSTYETYVQERILAPLGITTMRIGASLPAGRDPLEVRYYQPPGTRLSPSVFPAVEGLVPGPDGSFCLEAMDSHGGWIASARDLVTFALACDGRPEFADILKPESVAAMLARPTRPDVAADAAAWYGLGWSVRQAGDGLNSWHNGSLPGTSTLLVRTQNGYVWAVLYNTRLLSLSTATDELMWHALSQVTDPVG